MSCLAPGDRCIKAFRLKRPFQRNQHRRRFLRTASQIGFFAVVAGAMVAAVVAGAIVVASAIVVGVVIVCGAIVVGATVVAGAHLGSMVVAGGATGFTVTRVTRPALSTTV